MGVENLHMHSPLWMTMVLLFLLLAVMLLVVVAGPAVAFVYWTVLLKFYFYVYIGHGRRATLHIDSAAAMGQCKINKMPNLYLNKLKRWL